METERFITRGELEQLADGRVPVDMQDWWSWLRDEDDLSIGFWLLASGIQVGPYTTAMLLEDRRRTDEMAGNNPGDGSVPDSGDSAAADGISPDSAPEAESELGAGDTRGDRDTEYPDNASVSVQDDAGGLERGAA